MSDIEYDAAVQREYAKWEKWSGESVAQLPLDVLNHDPSLQSIERLQSTIPEEYRGNVYEVAGEPSHSNSLDYQTRSAEIIAIDASNNALVRLTTSYNYEDVDSERFVVLSKQDAFARIDEYRASHDLDRAGFSSPAYLTDNEKSQYLDGQNIDEYRAAHGSDKDAIARPVTGESYVGRIEAVSGETVLQRVSADQVISHERGLLAGADPASLVGQNVEVRYPLGTIGVVREAFSQQMPEAVKDIKGLEKSIDHGLGDRGR